MAFEGQLRDSVGPATSDIHRESEKNSSRKPTVPKVATYRITSHAGEYLGVGGGDGPGPRGACSGLSTPCIRMQNSAVVVPGHEKSRGC
jgi:hypothetical protein